VSGAKVNEEVGDLPGQASALGGLASAYARKGDWDRATEHLEYARKTNDDLGDRYYLSITLQKLARANLATDQIDDVIECAQEAVRVSRGKQLERAEQLLAELSQQGR